MECDQELEKMLTRLDWYGGDPGKAKRCSHPKNAPRFDARTYLFKMCGVDLTRIDSID